MNYKDKVVEQKNNKINVISRWSFLADTGAVTFLLTHCESTTVPVFPAIQSYFGITDADMRNGPGPHESAPQFHCLLPVPTCGYSVV